MRSYKGNRYPFCCALFAKADAADAAAVLETLDRQRIRYAVPTRRSANCIARAATVLLFLSPEAARDEAVLKGISKACVAGKPILTVYLKETQLTPGLSMQLGQTQGILKYREESEETFRRKLLNAPALNAMSITPQQKHAMRRHTLAWALGGTAVLIAALLIGLYWQPIKAMLPDSPFSKIGVSGSSHDFDGIETLYIYGETQQDAYTMPQYRLYADGEHDWTQINGQLIPQGDITVLDDFSMLKNLRELCICNNPIQTLKPILSLTQLTLLDVSHDQIQDLGGIGALSELETLNVSYNPISSLDGISDLKKLRTLNLSHTDLTSLDALLSLPALETVYLDSGMTGKVTMLGKTTFAIEYTDTPVYQYKQLTEALEDPSVSDIRIMGAITIPEDADITIRPGVSVSDVDRMYCYVTNYGTVRVEGVWSASYYVRNNYGTLIVEDGGLYTGGSCATYNRGTFRIEKGGRQNLESGATFCLMGGRYENNGDVYLQDGCDLQYNSGTIVNNGSLFLFSLHLSDRINSIPADRLYNSGTVYLGGFPILSPSKTSGTDN